MPARRIVLTASASPGRRPQPDVAAGLDRIREELDVPTTFPAEVEAAARQAAAAPRLPDLDRTDLELVTIDPPGSTDLDQALHLAAVEKGYVVSYAIADVAAFVRAGDPIDQEAHRRGVTRYAPDRRTPLHPAVLSEDAASLLPGRVRPALLWTITLDRHGRTTAADVVRARIRSREQLTYAQAQAEIDGPEPRSALALLARVGALRQQRERERGGVSLDIPEQEVLSTDRGWQLRYRAPLPVEGWNAQLSLLTGMAAAHLMLYGQVGILRTMPPPAPDALRRLRQIAKALRVGWPAELDYPEFVRGLDAADPAHAAMLNACTALFRGAGYQGFDGDVPIAAEHAALASDYTHATAPLRRLVDRYAGEACLALCAGTAVPRWVRAALPRLPAEMAAATAAAHRYDRAVLDWVEACVLADRVGEVFTGTVVEVRPDRHRGVVMLRDPAVEAPVEPPMPVGVPGDPLPLGHDISIRLTEADPARGAVSFETVQEGDVDRGP